MKWTKEAYLEKRNELLAEAENLLNEGKVDEYEEKEKEIKALDEEFEKFAKAQANINSLKDQNPAGVVVNMTQQDDEGKVATTEGPKDEQEVYLNAWAKEMMGQSLNDEEKSLFDKINHEFRNATQTTEEHGVLIPETVRENIWREAGELYPILNDVRMLFVPGNLTLLKETDSGDDAAWYDEDTEVADGAFGIGELNLTGCELAKSIPISWKLRKMSIGRFIPYITTLLAEKMGAALAKAIVSGKGKPGDGDTFKPQPRGIVTALQAETDTPQIITYNPDATEPDPLNYDKLTKAMSLIKSAYKRGAAIYANNNTIWNRLATIKDGQGRPLFVPDVTTSDGVGRIFGVVVKEDDSVADDAVLIGNVGRGYAMNVNENMTIYTEDHKKKRYTDYMSYAIVDGDVRTTKAFAYIVLVPQV
ncbi:HK97 family phage major capsid protein [Melghiribacillus thermohalophilus]|uniref:HK97 family phage major capsid protein n=1 Tax=Melghiribacillus thermohalophilus TaxID=1324956 RepID=A0A4R3N5M7_9BACI|nr:phage major capsid protein [Melghiribacillus thermohalophilus]TCT23386.1 HK97 family phage major capsid protein [Melghiribacillus thermohalophilus]